MKAVSFLKITMTPNFISSMPLNSAFLKESKNVKNVNFAKAVVEKAQLAKHAQKIFLTLK